jgi:hypothetical protein
MVHAQAANQGPAVICEDVTGMKVNRIIITEYPVFASECRPASIVE